MPTHVSNASQVLYRTLGEPPQGGPFSFAALLMNQTGADDEEEDDNGDEEFDRQWGLSGGVVITVPEPPTAAVAEPAGSDGGAP